MKKFPLITALITLIILLGGIALFSPKNPKVSSDANSQSIAGSKHEFYWSLTCPHCENVENFLETWSGKDKIEIEKYEVTSDRTNALKLIQRGQTCRIDDSSIGAVPLLFTPEGKCLLGDTPIISYLESLKL